VVGSQKQSLPVYFTLAIVGGDAGNVMLKNRIAELIRVVELIEQKRENEENLKERKSAVNENETVIHCIGAVKRTAEGISGCKGLLCG